MNNNNNSQFLSTKKAIKKWLDKYHIKNCTINDDFSVDVNAEVNLAHKNLKTFPVNFGNVTGYFWCEDNKLTSLVGSPKSVGKSFFCQNNQLINLTGFAFPSVRSPKSVGGSFNCDNNNLINLVGSPESVGRDFCCSGNPLISLAEMINCNIEQMFYFNVDKENFKPKELVKLLGKYYSKNYKAYWLTMNDFHTTIKPLIEKEILDQKLKNSNFNKKINKIFI